ncbi:MAG: hypothetical protein JSW28_09380 [Thermoplasmata archaeon]|nr:MAG: hypothetical protein JSW28_09380 [Thermoplasmata archaeon]
MDRETRELLAKLFTKQLEQLAKEKDIDCGENPDRIDLLSILGNSEKVKREDIERYLGETRPEAENQKTSEERRSDVYLGEVEKVLKNYKSKAAIFDKADEQLHRMQGNFEEGNFGGTISQGIKSSGLIHDLSKRYENVRRAFMIMSFRQLISDVKEAEIDAGEAETQVFKAAELFHNQENEALDGILKEMNDTAEHLQKEQAKKIKDMIFSVEEFIAQAMDLGADVEKAKKSFREAEDAFDSKKFKKVHQQLAKARKAAEDARRDRIQGLSDSLLFVKSILDDARDIGADVSDADELYIKAKSAFDEENYGESKVLIKEVEALALELQDAQIKKAMKLRMRREGVREPVGGGGEEVVEVQPEAVVPSPQPRSMPRYRQPPMRGYPQQPYPPPVRPPPVMQRPQRMRKTRCPNCGQRFPVQGGPGPVRVECPFCGMRGMMP